ncbi:MAG: Ureidoglycolate hydrolase [Merismopedia sp. SIO2A8]|nr:Ureidoglycolate hydrolase [Merismopedia sp. SIO2A8]
MVETDRKTKKEERFAKGGALQSLTAQLITPETFKPFGQVILPSKDGDTYGPDDAQLDLRQGVPRFYIMHLKRKGRHFSKITRHQACTQCLGSLNGQEWLMAVAPPGPNPQPDPSSIKAFRIPGDRFIKLDVGTWHAGPLFDQDSIDFYNLELSDTNVVDHHTCDLSATFGLRFTIV